MADKPPTTMPPASEPFPGSRTPGWNDPPTLAYNPLSASSSGGPGRPRISLNKRVAYPLQGSVAGTAPSTSKPMAVVLPNQASAGLPLPPPPPPTTSTIAIMHPVAVVHPMPHATNQQENITLPTDAVTTSLRCLREQVPLVQESINVRREEIERRLGIIEQFWQSGNLSLAVQQKIYQLSQAVRRSSYNEAMELYTSLVANHANECSSWAVTLRHIVLTIPPLSTTATAAATTTSHTTAAVATIPPHIAPSTIATNDISNNAAAAAIATNNTTASSSSSSSIIVTGTLSSSSNNPSAVPTMSVTAMPRSSAEEAAFASASTARVQHI